MITTVNPYTGKDIKVYKEPSHEECVSILEKVDTAQKEWKKTSFEERGKIIIKIGEHLRNNTDKYAVKMVEEMGKPISQARSELEKCAWLCDHYAEHVASYLADETIETDYEKSYVSYEPLGVILAVMPWNYPYWQVFRFIIPALMAGNTGVLKHASSVMGCAESIPEIFKAAGLPENCFRNLVIGSDKVEKLIQHDIVKAVTLTGSKPAGSAVASTAAADIKKSVLELGGNNALVVMKDADIEKTVETCVTARYQNTGQSCIAGKRLMIHEDIYEKFLDVFTEKVKSLKSGNPMDEDTYIGVMSRADLAEELEEMMKKSIDAGAKLHLGGNRDKAYFEPTILTDVTPDMPVYREETFGPLIAVTKFTSEGEAIDMVNDSKFGLGASLFSKDTERMETLARGIKDGAVFINEKVTSHPALPFGGTGISGYGRELSHFGIREFVNIKTVVVA
jgi:succinate-semialdehyde dehydrogenase/glutarate-semialdehyde dehydrogenase